MSLGAICLKPTHKSQQIWQGKQGQNKLYLEQINRGGIVIKGKFKYSRGATAALIHLYKQAWDDIRLVMGIWCSEQLPDPDAVSAADYLKTGGRVSFCAVVSPWASFPFLCYSWKTQGEPRSKWVALQPEWIPNVGFGCHIQLGMFESFVYLEILEQSAWNPPMAYAKDFRDAFNTHQCTLGNECLWKYIFTGIFMAAKELLHSYCKSCNDSSGIISDPLGHQNKARYTLPLQISNSRCLSFRWRQRNKITLNKT